MASEKRQDRPAPLPPSTRLLPTSSANEASEEARRLLLIGVYARASQRASALEPVLFQKLLIYFATSLMYICLLTRGCSRWGPDAVMGTVWCESSSSHTTVARLRFPGFQGPLQAFRIPQDVRCFSGFSPPSPDQPIPGGRAGQTGKRSLLGAPMGIPKLSCVA